MPSWKKVVAWYGDPQLNSVTSTTYVSASEFIGPLVGTSSFATSASYAVFATNAGTASYSPTLGASLGSPANNQVSLVSSTGAVLSSVTINNVVSSSYALTASYAENVPSALTASYALTASSANDFNIRGSLTGSSANFSGNVTASNLLVNNTITAQTLVVQVITSSTEFITGSTKFGSQLTDTHQFTGSVTITGSLGINGVDYTTTSASFDTRILANSSSIAILSSSFESLSGSFSSGSFTGSFTGSFNGFFNGQFSGSLQNLRGQNNFISVFSGSNDLTSSIIYQSGSSIAINETNFTSGNPEALYVFQTDPTSINVITGKGNLNNYLQLNIQNTNQGISASSDVVATANNGNEFGNYIDMGINSENFATNFIGGPNDAYLYSTGSNLHIGNASDNGSHIQFFVGGTDAELYKKLQLNPAGPHEMTGSLRITGSLTVTNGITGSLFGTSSWAVSASHAPSALTSSYALTSSFAPNYTLTSSFTAFTQSYYVDSASFSTRITNNSSSIATLSSSYLASSASFDTRILTNSSSIATLSSSYLASSASFDTRILNNSSSIATLSSSYLASSASFDTRILTVSSSLGLLSSSYLTDSASFSTRSTNNSSSIAILSSSFLNASASFDTRILTNSSSVASLSASYLASSASFDTRILNNSSSVAILSSSFLTTSASFENVSQSYASLSGSFRTGSYTGSFIGTGSYSLSALSSSYAISASHAPSSVTASYALFALTSSNALTASSADNFIVRQDITGSNALFTGTITAQTLNVQVITSSVEFVTGSTRFGSQLTDTHQFTGSVSITGSLSINNVDYTSTSASFDSRILANSSSVAILSSSYLASSASFDTRILTVSSSLGLLSSSYLVDSASFSTRSTNNSSSIAILSGSFLTTSASFDTRILSNSSSIATLSASFLSASASFDTRINNLTESVFTHIVTNNGASNYIIDGVAKPKLSFVPGATYRFNTSGVVGSHPFKFSTSPNGPTEYTTGVTSGSNYIQIEINYDTPTTLYYYCTIHSGMGNEINTLRIDTLVTTASFNSFTSSYYTDSASFSTRATNNSSSIAILSGSFLTTSASFENVSASYSQLSSSFRTGSYTGSFTGSFLGTGSNAVSASYAFNADFLDGKDSSVFATTGSNIFVGNQTVTGSLFTTGSNTLIGSTALTGSLNITGSTVQVGNNTLIGTTVLSGSITISGSNTPGSTTASVQIYGDIRQSGYHRFDPVTTNIDNSVSASYIYVSGSTQDLYFAQNSKGYTNTTRLRWIEGNLYTGLLHGGLITTQSSTVYQVSSGSGIIVDLNASLNDDPYPTIQYLNWGNLSASIAPLTASYQQAFVSIDSTGNIYQQGTPYVAGQFDTVINIGVVLFQNQSTINGVKTQPSTAYGFEQSQNIFNRAFGPLKLSGFTLAPSGSSTGSLVVGSGTAYSAGSNYAIDPNNPSYASDPGTSVSKIFRYYQSGSTWIYQTNGGAGFQAIDPTQYANNGVLTAVPAPVNSNWTIQRVFWFPNSVAKAIVVYYGNAYYGSESEAIANINIESFVEAPNTAANAIYLGAIVISGDGVFTDVDDFTIVPGGLFRSVGGSGGGGSVITTRLVDLSDVAISGPTDLQPLAYSTTAAKWINTSNLSASIAGNAATATTASYAATASFVLNAVSASYALQALTASNALTASSADNFVVRQNLTGSNALFSGTITAQTLNVQVITSSVDFVTGSTIFGSDLSNTHQFTGSVTITGSLSVNNSPVITTNQTSSMIVLSSSFASTSSYVQTAQTASYVLNAQTASYVQNAQTASYVLNAVSASYASQALSSSYAITASYAENVPLTASYALKALSASYSDTASVATTASYAVTASYALNAGAGGVSAIYIADEGNIQGTASFFDFVGAGVTATITNGTASINIPGGGGGTGGVVGQNAILTQSVASTTWSFTHNLGTQYPVFTIFDANDDVIIPQRIYAASTSSAFVYFSTARTGYAVAALGGGIVSSSYAVSASFASFATSASYALSSSQAITASYVLNAQTASYVQNAQTASYVQNAQTASYVLNAQTASYVQLAQSASYVQNAQSASYVLNAVSASYSLTSSYSVSSSFADSATSASYAITSSFSVSSSYASQSTSASYALSATSASYALSSTTASYALQALTASNSLTASSADNFVVRQNITASNGLFTGTITAQTLVVQTVTSSFVYSSGSNIFGNDLTNTQQLTGSVTVTGSLAVNNSPVILTNQTSSMTVLSSSFASTASYVQNAQTASYILVAVSASYASQSLSSSFASTASYVQNAQSASYVLNAVSASYSTQALSSSYSLSGSFATTASYAVTAAYAANVPSTASYALQALSSSYALTASFALNGGGGGISAVSIADEGTLQGSASYFDFTGAGVTATVTNGTASINITGTGGGSSAGLSTTFTQSVAADPWTFIHNLNTRTPLVQVYDTSYNQITPQYVSASNANTVIIGFGVATAGYAVASTGGTLVVTGSNVILNQSVAATTWSFAHNLNTQYPVFQVFNSADEVIIPEKIVASSTTGSFIYFPSAISGKAVASVGGLSGSISASYAIQALSSSYASNALSSSYATTASFALNGGVSSISVADEGTLIGSASYFDFIGNNITASVSNGTASITIIGATGTSAFTQSTAAATWSFVHNLNTFTPLIQAYTSTYNQLIPNEIVGIDPNVAEIRFDYAQAGYAVASNGGDLTVSGSTARLDQTSAAVTWSFAHNLNSQYVNFEVYDANNFVIIPANIKAVNSNNAELYFATPTSGVAIAMFSGINGAPNAVTASYALSGSNFYVSNTIKLNGTLTDTATVLSSVVGSNNLFTQATGSFTSAFFKYTAASGSNARSGEVMAVWNGSSVEFTDNSTADIGTTSAVTGSIVLAAGDVQFNMQTNTSGWRIKSIATFM